ncbi:MAG: ComEC family competence protein [Chitinispirillales bacterium]|jgi:ComEC/Rec2-related protein|nr:ComEC family competence protein [Chitinispirillales bacterium]
MKIAKVFPGLSYWSRLPGFASFCGISAGICAAKTTLASVPDYTPDISLYNIILILSMIISTASGILCRRPILRAIFFAISGAALFAGAEFGIRDFYRKMEEISEYSQIFTLTVRITSPVAQTVYAGGRTNNRFRGRVAGADDAAVGQALTGKTLLFTSRGTVPPYGMITVQGRYNAPRPAAGPLGFDQREYFAVSNIHGGFLISRILSDEGGLSADGQAPSAENPSTKKQSLPFDHISHLLRLQVHNVINKSTNHDVRRIFHAAFLGEKEHLTNELNTLFRKSGIVHLLAISGFHAALLFSAIFAALGLLPLSKKHKTLISLAALWFYLFFIGFIPSLFRATVMVTFVCVATMIQRKNHTVHSLGIAGVFWLYISPYSLFAPGFQLSFAATAGIIMMQPVFNTLTRAVSEKIHNKPIEFIVKKTLSPFWVSVAGFAATAPPLLHHFGALSLYGIFFNLIAIPLMSAAMWLFFAAIVLSPINFLANITVWCAEKVLVILIHLGKYCELISFSEIVVPKTTALQLFVMTAFMAGLCTVYQKLRGAYMLRAGAATALIIAITAAYTSINSKTENLEFTRGNSTINVVTHKDNSAWIIAQGRRNDIRQLRTREVEPFLHRKKIKNVPLFLINQEAEEEAHEFVFSMGLNPHTIVMRPNNADGRSRNNGGRNENDGYTQIDYRVIISANGACSLRVNSTGRAEILTSR